MFGEKSLPESGHLAVLAKVGCRAADKHAELFLGHKENLRGLATFQRSLAPLPMGLAINRRSGRIRMSVALFPAPTALVSARRPSPRRCRRPDRAPPARAARRAAASRRA